jgi:HEAT repeat protein
LTEDRELQKQIAAEAQTDAATAASPAVRAFQFFLVPLLIVGVCVLVVAGLTWVVANPRSAKDWLQDVKEGGPGVRPFATLKLCETLRRMDRPDPTLTPEIIALFKQPPAPNFNDKINMRAYLAACLGHLRDPQASGVLLEAIRSDDLLETRIACIEALGAIKDPSTLEPLVKLLDDKEDAVRKYAAFNVGAVAEKSDDRAEAVAALKKALDDPRADVGWNAALALAYFLRDSSGTGTLKKMLDRKYLAQAIDPRDPGADQLAARTLAAACNAAAKLGDDSFLPLLRRLTDDQEERDANVRFIAHKAIGAITSK